MRFAPPPCALFWQLHCQKCSEPEGFWQFDFGMCFAPQPRATFEHLNFQERSRDEVLLPFWFLTSKRASRRKGVHFFHVSTAKSGSDLKCFSILTSTCSSRHSSEQFLISQLPRWLHNRRFSEPTFRPSGATKQWKNRVFHDFSTYPRPASSFLWLFLFSELLSSSPLFSDSSHLCCFICPHYRKFDFIVNYK